jgi:hypothetical protein
MRAKRVEEGTANGVVGDGVECGGMKACSVGVRRGRASGLKTGWADKNKKKNKKIVSRIFIPMLLKCLQSSLSSSIVLHAQFESPLRKIQDSVISSSDVSGSLLSVSHSPGGYIAPDNLRSVVAASSDVKRDLTGSTRGTLVVIMTTKIFAQTIINA